MGVSGRLLLMLLTIQVVASFLLLKVKVLSLRLAVVVPAVSLFGVSQNKKATKERIRFIRLI
ncbi:hypothetical protein, partial [Bacteroides sp.]